MNCQTCQNENEDAARYCTNCGQQLQKEITCFQCHHVNQTGAKFCQECGQLLSVQNRQRSCVNVSSCQPSSFASGRYNVKKLLGEGQRKIVYLARDTVLDRDVAFALIKTEKLDDTARLRIRREAQTMGRLGDHPNIVTVFDFGDHEGQPFMVLPLLPGGAVENLIDKAPERRLPLATTIEIAKSICCGLEFAHSQSVVHRDLKPGNVWLSAEGTAKIGDFGLAVALDLSRLTKSGTMVGTVSYMPPEQAMGGSVTSRADMYSLGAMLYEMVTGRPPFVGDDPISIIGQHINIPPVSPARVRPELPEAFETLILHLLEKDPEKRPASAAVVLQALKSIEASMADTEPFQPVAVKASESPVFRRVFVGRESELKQLQIAFDNAISGKGALALVAGEPGIGKTSLCEQLATYVSLRGGRTLFGHCYGNGAPSLPYLAFVETLRSYVLSRPPDDLRKEMGSGAADISRIVPEIQERFTIEPPASRDPLHERHALMQAVTDFLANTSIAQPLLIVLEDLHDSDKGTLDMLAQLSRNLGRMRLLIVGTYRDVEVDRSHPLSTFLAEFRRLPSFMRIALRGLTDGEVQRMLENVVEEEIPGGLAEAVHLQTEGNPLFVQEVMRYLIEEGVVSRETGRWQATGQTPIAMAIPEGLRDVIGKRLSRLGEKCNRILSIAAVIGRNFNLQVLQKVAGVTEDELYTALEEATAAAVLEESSTSGTGTCFRFAHAFFRQTLYEELFTPRRIRIHEQIGQALEEVYGNRVEEHAAELAEHFSQSTETVDLARLVLYGQMAARRAMSVYAYGEGVRLLEQVVKAQEVLDPLDKLKRCELLLAMGQALLMAGEPRRCLDHVAPEAFALAEEMADHKMACLVSRLACHALLNHGQQLALVTPEGRLWVERGDRNATPESNERACADQYLGLLKVKSDQVVEGRTLLKQGLDLARHSGDDSSFLRAARHWLNNGSPREDAVERLIIAEEMMQKRHAATGVIDLGSTLSSLFGFFLQVGQRERLEEVLGELRKLTQRSKQANQHLNYMRLQAALDIVDGRLEKATEIVHQMLTIGNEMGLKEFARINIMAWPVTSLLETGKADEALQIIQNILEPTNSINKTNLALCLSHLGRKQDVAEILRQLVLANPTAGSARDETLFDMDLRLLEAATRTEHHEAASLLLRRFEKGNIPPFGGSVTVCSLRLLGAAKILLGKHEEARTDFEEALKVSIAMKFRPEVALTRLHLAELLLDHYPAEKSEAQQHLDFAMKEFCDMKMQPSLERALRRKDVLKA